MSLWKRAGCQTELKAFEKSTAVRIVREPGPGLLNPSEMDCERKRISAWRGERIELDSRKKSRLGLEILRCC